jgi:ankyrin repeat protein
MPENKDDIDLDGWDLHRAAKESRVDIVRALIERGDDVNAMNENGETPLHIIPRIILSVGEQ